MASSNTYNTPCAACKFLRRKCMPDCLFAPYFPPEEPQKFVNVHKLFGASNITKLLNDILPHQREDAVNSLAYEAEARVRDPVYGCVGAISFLQMQVDRLQKELAAANSDLIRLACSEHPSHINIYTALPPPPPPPQPPSMVVHRLRPPVRLFDHHGGGGGGGGANSTNNTTTTTLNTIYQTPSTFSFTYSLPWASYDHNPSPGNINGGGGGLGGGRNN